MMLYGTEHWVIKSQQEMKLNVADKNITTNEWMHKIDIQIKILQRMGDKK